jgi:Carboxypeptidase regulatory-like domain
MRSRGWSVFARGIVAGIAVTLIVFGSAIARGQEPPPPPPQETSPGQQSSSSKPQKQKYSHTHDFLVIGTVFDAKGYAFPGVELKIRRSTEKKFRWDSLTNSRGEFAIRVPQGSDYELIVRHKGAADQTRELNANTGLSEARIVFRMEIGKDEKK